MILAYLAGLNTPGGFWDHKEGGHQPGDAVLKGRYDARLNVFFVLNTTAFYASLLIIVQLLDKADRSRLHVLYFFIVSALFGLVGAYSAGSSRETSTTMYMIAVVVVLPACSLIQVVILRSFAESIKEILLWKHLLHFEERIKRFCIWKHLLRDSRHNGNGNGRYEE